MTTLTQTLSFPAHHDTPTAPHAVRAIKFLMERLDAWKLARQQARADQEMWAMAQIDARVMTDLTCAQTRNEV